MLDRRLAVKSAEKLPPRKVLFYSKAKLPQLMRQVMDAIPINRDYISTELDGASS
jgi:hypothetical protein